MHQAMHKNSRRVNFIGVELAWFDDDFRFGNCDLAATGGIGVEVARGAAIDEVAMKIGLPRLDQRQIGANAALKDMRYTVEFLMLFSLGDERSYAGLGIEAGYACASSSHAFGERALRAEFDFDFTAKILSLKLYILADIT